MRWLGGALLLLLSPLVGAVLAELRDCAPWLAERLLQQAVRRLPEPDRDRYGEEWTAILNDVPGKLLKLAKAFGFLLHAPFVGRAARGLPPISQVLIGRAKSLRPSGRLATFYLTYILVMSVLGVFGATMFLRDGQGGSAILTTGAALVGDVTAIYGTIRLTSLSGRGRPDLEP